MCRKKKTKVRKNVGDRKWARSGPDLPRAWAWPAHHGPAPRERTRQRSDGPDMKGAVDLWIDDPEPSPSRDAHNVFDM